ncbi:DUF2255 family protein [Streptomyces violaceusniger]|uniref:Uncharacterized conserved protein UCP028498 n=1 Tax=Streptomyces violaceusniger (strain Tu 4113) TaxID=653045 RepID=G2PF49_STRV4|nr:DUF2255 family protein [Streptomyces violaceusniger]AEM84055.1 Uncharacterized conserved protein UCP028498 [Streptomyces violaceusniger Tu 4113]
MWSGPKAAGPDGSLRDPVIMWVVRYGDDIYVRSVKGRSGPWFRGTRSRSQGRIRAGGVHKDVSFQDADPNEWAGVDAAYRAKYGAYTGIVDRVLTEQARESTIRLAPR